MRATTRSDTANRANVAEGGGETNKHTYIDGMPSTITSARLSDRRSQHRSLLASEWLSQFPDDSQPMNLWGPIGSKSRMELQIAPPYTKARCVRQPKSKTRQSTSSTQQPQHAPMYPTRAERAHSLAKPHAS